MNQGQPDVLLTAWLLPWPELLSFPSPTVPEAQGPGQMAGFILT